MTPDDARELGAQALFGEKYGDEVRVVSMGVAEHSNKGLDKNTYSIELCGGTHVAQTGEIGSFVVTSESASAAGVRRIEALTGKEAQDYLAVQDSRVKELASLIKAKPEDLVARINALMDERKAQANEIADLRKAVAMGGVGGDNGGPNVKKIGDVNFVGQVLKGVPGKDLRGLIDEQKSKIGSGVICLISDADGKAAVATGVTDDLTGKISAVDLVKAAAEALGGKGGGGRPDMAQAGGPSAENAEAALAAVEKLLEV